MWMDAVEDICAARKRLLGLASAKPGDYRVRDSSRQIRRHIESPTQGFPLKR
jgi:hypothetical protein